MSATFASPPDRKCQVTTTQYLRVFARFWPLVVLCAAAGLVLGILFATPSSPPTKYVSTSSVLVTGTPATESGAADASQTTVLAQQRMATYADIASGPTLAKDILKDSDVRLSAAQLEDRIDVVVPASSSVLRISVTDTDPDRAKLLASRAGPAVVHIVDDVENLKGRDFALLRARVVVDASTPIALPVEVAPPAWRNPVLGTAGGLLLGLALAVAVSRLDPRLTDEGAVSEALEAPVLGNLPAAGPGKSRIGPRRNTQGWDASVRELRTNVFFRQRGPDHCLTVAVTSPRPDDRVLEIVCDVATALVDTGARVLLVDADLRRPHPVPLLGQAAQDAPGLAAHLAGTDADEELIWHDAQSGCYVLPAGAPPASPEGLLHLEAFAALLDDAAQRFDFVLVATPAMNVGTDTLAVAARCDGTLLAVRPHRTTLSQAASARGQLDRVDAELMGAVLLT
jgi:Mrp family chromosome partitioning ATPase